MLELVLVALLAHPVPRQRLRRLGRFPDHPDAVDRAVDGRAFLEPVARETWRPDHRVATPRPGTSKIDAARDL